MGTKVNHSAAIVPACPPDDFSFTGRANRLNLLVDQLHATLDATSNRLDPFCREIAECRATGKDQGDSPSMSTAARAMHLFGDRVASAINRLNMLNDRLDA